MKRARSIIITGGGNGIGRATALLCGGAGDRITILDRDEAAANETAERALASGAQDALAIACDVTSEAQVEAAIRRACERFDAPSGVFANVGIDLGGYIHELPLVIWHRVLETNVTGVFLTCKYALQRMLEAKIPGSIVCTSSPGGFVAFAAGASGAYSASKGAISALVRCMAIDYAPYGIRVNAIVPGATDTSLMWRNLSPEQVPRITELLRREIPLARLAEPIEPARAVLWLFSDDSSYVTGSQLVCDGGILAKASISV